MAIYRFNRKFFSNSGATTDRFENDLSDISSRLISPSLIEPQRNNLWKEVAVVGIISSIIYAIWKFFKSKSGAAKYKASAEEIEAIKKELPEEYEKFREIRNKVVNECKFIFSSEGAFDFYLNTLPSLLNLNGEEWIAGWARETGKKGPRWAPILPMYNCKYVICFDFDKKYWFVIINGGEYLPNTSIFQILENEFIHAKKLANKNLTDYPKVLAQTNTYLDLNIKLIKKSKTTLRRKSFGFVGALFGAKNWKAAIDGTKALSSGTKTLTMGERIGEGAKGLAKAAGTTAVSAGVVGGANAFGGGDLLSGGEKSAKKMEFS